MKYERLTIKRENGFATVRNTTLQGLIDRLAELEDKIECGELISTQLKDSSEQEFAFFMNHNKSVRKLFADELKARLQDAVTLRNITRKVYDVIESEINYCYRR